MALSAITEEMAMIDPEAQAIRLLAVADHDAALIGLTNRDHGIAQERSGLLGDDDLSAARLHWSLEPHHRRQPRIAESRAARTTFAALISPQAPVSAKPPARGSIAVTA